MKKENKLHQNIQDTMSLFGVDWKLPYYLSSGNELKSLPEFMFRMDYFSICLCTAGSIKVEIENTQYKIIKNEFIIAKPSTIIRFLKQSKDFRMKLLIFDKYFLVKKSNAPFVLDHSNIFIKKPFQIINLESNEAIKMLQLFKYLEEKTHTKSPYRDDIIRTVIQHILLETAEHHYKNMENDDSIKKDNNSLYHKFTALIEQYILVHTDVQFYADQLCISPKYLIQVIKKKVDKTPSELITEAILKEAYLLLSNRNLNISEIAYRLNFSSTASFTRFFKRNTLQTPVNYRKDQ